MILNNVVNLTFHFFLHIYKNKNKLLKLKIMEQRKINGYVGYEINEKGDVFSYKQYKPKQLKQQKVLQSKKGYFQVRLYDEGDSKFHYVHRLVWETFVGEIPSDKQIDHIDGDTSNNHISNLELVTGRENIKKYHNAVDKYRNHRDQFIKDYEELGSFNKVVKKWGCSSSTAWYVYYDMVMYINEEGKHKYRPYKKF